MVQGTAYSFFGDFHSHICFFENLGRKIRAGAGFLAGLLEIVPVIGPIISAIPAVFLTLLYSPFKALLVLILFILIQQFENHILVPKVMQKSVGLHPIIVIVAMLMGAKLGGITGALVALPIATVADVISPTYILALKKNQMPADNSGSNPIRPSAPKKSSGSA